MNKRNEEGRKGRRRIKCKKEGANRLGKKKNEVKEKRFANRIWDVGNQRN